jgi:hypothetical protein
MTAVGQLGKQIGIARACRALEVPRATFYRRRKTAVEVIPKARRAHARKLSEEEQAEIKSMRTANYALAGRLLVGDGI